MGKKTRKNLAALEKAAFATNTLDEFQEIVDEWLYAKANYKAYVKSVALMQEAPLNVIISGVNYSKVNRKAKQGDVIAFAQGIKNKIKKGEFYEAVESPFGTIFLNEEGDELKIYTGDGMIPVVYENVYKNKDGESALELVEEKTPNELRAEIIEKAKLFLSEEKGTVFEFIIQDKRILVLNNGEKLFAESKCHSNDVFNSHIGKAIALGRALNLDVSEFENAAQPNELAVGMVIRRNYYKSAVTYEREIEKVKGEALYYTCGGYDADIDSADNLTIIDDTKAQYGGERL